MDAVMLIIGYQTILLRAVTHCVFAAAGKVHMPMNMNMIPTPPECADAVLCCVMSACRPPSLQSPQHLGVPAVPAAQYCGPQQPASPSGESSLPLYDCGLTQQLCCDCTLNVASQGSLWLTQHHKLVCC